MRIAMLFACTALAALPAAAHADALDQATAEDPIELTMYYPIAVGGPLQDVMDGLVAGFEAEHPHIDVEAVYSGNYDETMVQTQSAIDAGDPPATTVLLSTELFSLAADELIVPFDDVVQTEEEREWLDSFYEPFMANSRGPNGKTWGIPFQRSTIVQYWNKDAFEQAGLDPDQPPRDWEELRAMAAQVQEKSQVSWGVQVPSSGFPYWLFQAFTTQNGVEIVGSDGASVNFDDPRAVEALKYWISLQEDGVHPPGVVDWGTTPQDFLQEETAIIWTTTGNLGNVRDNADFDFGVSMLPANERRGSPTGGGNFYLFADVSEAERRAALQLVRYMTEPEQLAEWSIKTGYVAPRPEAWETERMQDYAAEFPAATVARDQLQYAVRELSTYERGRIYQVLNDALQAAIVGDATPQEALSGAQQRAEEILAPYR